MRKLWIPLIVLVLAALACSLPGGGGNATPVREAEATQAPPSEQATAVPTSEPAGGAPALSVSSDALSSLESYRARSTSQWTPTGGTPEGMTWVEEYTREPAAHRILVEGSEGTVEIVQIGDMAWFCSNGQCAQTTQSEEDVLSGMGAATFDPADFTTDTDYTYVGQETVNGIRTRHYTLNLSAAEVALLSQGSVSDIYADVWVADQSGLPEFVVRYRMGWKETRADVEGTVEYLSEVYDVNASFTIEPPEGAAGMPGDVPTYPGATDLMVMEGLVTFSAADDVPTVADFYRNELAAQGWTNTSDETAGGAVSQTWTKGDRALTLMIGPGEGGGSSVIISLE